MINKIKIGTRGSKLALYQAEHVKSVLWKTFPDIIFEIEIIKTKGDKILDTALSKIGDKGLFTKEIEDALLEERIDIAVHSLKDLPTQLPQGLILGGVFQRGEVRDALINKDGKKIDQLTSKNIIATSSLRRKAQLLNLNKELKIIDIRGNVDTRLNKLKEGYCDTLILAGAGLQRLNYNQEITELIDITTMLPAVSQGIIGIESRETDAFTSKLLKIVTHTETMIAANAERTFLHVLQGGCQIPIGCYTEIKENAFTIEGFISTVNGNRFIKHKLSGLKENANDISKELALHLLNQGGKEILDKIRISTL